MSDWRTEGIEIYTGLDSRLGKDVAEAYAAARDQNLVTVLHEDHREAAAIVPLDEHGYPVAMGLAASWLGEAARMRAQAGTDRSAVPFLISRSRADQLEECARALEQDLSRENAAVYQALSAIIDTLDEKDVPAAMRVTHAREALRRLLHRIVPDDGDLAGPGEDETSRTALLFAALISADIILGEAASDVLPPRPGDITYRQHIETWLRGAGREAPHG